MARKLFAFDDDARRQLTNRSFMKEFESHREDFVGVAKRLYQMLAKNPKNLPLRADVQGLLGEYLYSDADFTALILKKVKSLETRHSMWCHCFAAMVVELAWDDIISQEGSHD